MKFSPTFLFYNIEVYDPLICNFRVWASKSAYEFFLELQSWPIRVKMCDIRRAVKICKLVGSFSLPEGLFQRAAKHHLHGTHCLAYIFERRSQKSTLLAICLDTPAQLQSDKCVCVVPPFRTRFLSTAFKQWRSSAMEMP